MHTVESAAIVLEASKCRDQERKEGGQNREGGFSARYSGQTGGLTGARVTLQRGDFARTYTIVRKFSEQLLVKAINSWKSTACVSSPNIDLQTRMHTKFWYRGWRYAIESVIPSNSLNAIPFVSGYESRPRISHIFRFFLSFLFQIYLYSASGSLILLLLRWNDFNKIYVPQLWFHLITNYYTFKDSRDPTRRFHSASWRVEKIPQPIPNCLSLSTLKSGKRVSSKITLWPNFLAVVYMLAGGLEGGKRWRGLGLGRAREKNEPGGSTLWPKC